MDHGGAVITVFLVVVFTLSFFSRAHAATLFLTPASFEIAIGEKVAVDLRIDNEGVSFNAAQATIRFPKDILEVVSIDKASSTFNFWLAEPTFSNAEGMVSFTGGTSFGVSGGAIQVLKIEFRAKGSGSGTLVLSDAAITASDGSGTNILSKTADAAFGVVIKKETPTFLPAQIVRTPVPTGALPTKPIIIVPVYPDENRWYNLLSPFTLRWAVPVDIIGISTAFNTQPNYTPPPISEGLFGSKTYPTPAEEVRYVHVRFQNDLGWGPAAHYRLAVDTTPPLGFEVSIVEGDATDQPAPTLEFKTSDILSGLKEYHVRIGNGDIIKIPAPGFNGTFQLPLLTPGKRQITVKALDQADNGIEQNLTLETIPIVSPAITFVTGELFSDEVAGLAVRGTSLPSASTHVRLYKKEEFIVEGMAPADDRGNWELAFNNPLRNGSYIVTAQSEDSRGALSLVVSSSAVQVKSKPIIQLGPFQLGKSGAALTLLLLLVVGFVLGVWFYKKRQNKVTSRVGFAESEVTKIFALILKDVEQLSKTSQTAAATDYEYALKRLNANIKKMESYLQKGLEKIKK